MRLESSAIPGRKLFISLDPTWNRATITFVFSKEVKEEASMMAKRGMIPLLIFMFGVHNIRQLFPMGYFQDRARSKWDPEKKWIFSHADKVLKNSVGVSDEFGFGSMCALATPIQTETEDIIPIDCDSVLAPPPSDGGTASKIGRSPGSKTDSTIETDNLTACLLYTSDAADE